MTTRRCGGAIKLPPWIKTDPYVLYRPEKTLFTPEKFLRMFEGLPYLVDCNEDAYLLRDCEQLRLEHLRKGITLLVTRNGPITIQPEQVCWFSITDGQKKLGIAPADPQTIAADHLVEPAARSLAEFFNGVVVSGEPEPEEEPGDG